MGVRRFFHAECPVSDVCAIVCVIAPFPDGVEANKNTVEGDYPKKTFTTVTFELAR